MKRKKLLMGWALILLGVGFCYGRYGHDSGSVNFSDHPDRWQLKLAGATLIVTGVSVLRVKKRAR